MEEILPQIDVFLPNETEAMGLSRTTTVQEAIVFISGRMRQGGLVVVTTGKSGAIARRGAEEFVGTSPTVEVVDTTGAGDAFNVSNAPFAIRVDTLLSPSHNRIPQQQTHPNLNCFYHDCTTPFPRTGCFHKHLAELGED